MKNTMKKTIALLLLFVVALATLVSCGTPETTPSVVFGFKTTDGASEYNESIDAFEIGKDFYTCIKVKLVTDKKSNYDFTVVVEVPKTKDIEVDQTGGKNADSVVWDEQNEKTVLTFTIQGSKEAVEEKIMFKGTPTGEGSAKMTVKIYDQDGVEIGTGYFRTIFFKYELQE